MKKILLIVCVLAFNFNTFSQEKIAKINFKTTVIDYGVIEKGSNGIRDFEFTNDGNSPLIITNVKSTCSSQNNTHLAYKTHIKSQFS